MWSSRSNLNKQQHLVGWVKEKVSQPSSLSASWLWMQCGWTPHVPPAYPAIMDCAPSNCSPKKILLPPFLPPSSSLTSSLPASLLPSPFLPSLLPFFPSFPPLSPSLRCYCPVSVTAAEVTPTVTEFTPQAEMTGSYRPTAGYVAHC